MRPRDKIDSQTEQLRLVIWLLVIAVSRAVALQAEQTAQDFVIRQLKSAIYPYQFEHFVAHLLKCMGYHTRVMAKSGDGGVDVIAHKDELGFEPPIIKVQCKQVTDPSGRPQVTQLLGNIDVEIF